MKFVAFGCVHGRMHPKIARSLRDCDAALCVGDLYNTDRLRQMEFDSLTGRKSYPEREWKLAYKDAVSSVRLPAKFLGSLDIPVFMVAGNNDFLGKDAGKYGLENFLGDNVKLLKSGMARFGDVHIAGFSYYRGISQKNSGGGAFANRLHALFSRIKHPERTILLMHDVPYGMFDVVKMKESPAYGKHVGEPLINENLRRKRLIAHVCAHMHEYQGIKMLHGTCIVNTGYGRAGKHAVIDVEGNSTVVEFAK